MVASVSNVKPSTQSIKADEKSLTDLLVGSQKGENNSADIQKLVKKLLKEQEKDPNIKLDAPIQWLVNSQGAQDQFLASKEPAPAGLDLGAGHS